MVRIILLISMMAACYGCGEAPRFSGLTNVRTTIQKTQIVNTQFPVAAGKYQFFQFASDRPSKVTGGFVAYGGSWMIPISMPVAGHCVGSFESYDDRDDLAVVVTDNLGRYIKKQPAGDIEILLLDAFALQARNAGRSYAAAWSSGRSFGGTYDISLSAGTYYFVISNSHSFLAPKSVTFTIGEKKITP